MSGIPLTEKDWKSWVIDAAKLCGWRYAHFLMAKTKRGWRTPQEGDLGFPDMSMVHPVQHRILFAELKVHPETQEKGRPSPGQEAWLEWLSQVPCVEAYVWRPSDKDQVLDILRGERRP